MRRWRIHPPCLSTFASAKTLGDDQRPGYWDAWEHQLNERLVKNMLITSSFGSRETDGYVCCSYYNKPCFPSPGMARYRLAHFSHLNPLRSTRVYRDWAISAVSHLTLHFTEPLSLTIWLLKITNGLLSERSTWALS